MGLSLWGALESSPEWVQAGLTRFAQSVGTLQGDRLEEGMAEATELLHRTAFHMSALGAAALLLCLLLAASAKKAYPKPGLGTAFCAGFAGFSTTFFGLQAVFLAMNATVYGSVQDAAARFPYLSALATASLVAGLLLVCGILTFRLFRSHDSAKHYSPGTLSSS
ncbi:MAG: hypothetical protein DWQ01_01625 [Planctomycetota bacterium]|nr:MAG: hypothetical protein DWQ01_01625 [Planctomycetota bacterium]